MTIEKSKTVTMELTWEEVEQAIKEFVKRHDRSVKDANDIVIVFDASERAGAATLVSAKVTLTVPIKQKTPAASQARA